MSRRHSSTQSMSQSQSQSHPVPLSKEFAVVPRTFWLVFVPWSS